MVVCGQHEGTPGRGRSGPSSPLFRACGWALGALALAATLWLVVAQPAEGQYTSVPPEPGSYRANFLLQEGPLSPLQLTVHRNQGLLGATVPAPDGQTPSSQAGQYHFVRLEPAGANAEGMRRFDDQSRLHAFTTSDDGLRLWQAGAAGACSAGAGLGGGLGAPAAPISTYEVDVPSAPFHTLRLSSGLHRTAGGGAYAEVVQDFRPTTSPYLYEHATQVTNRFNDDFDSVVVREHKVFYPEPNPSVRDSVLTLGSVDPPPAALRTSSNLVRVPMHPACAMDAIPPAGGECAFRPGPGSATTSIGPGASYEGNGPCYQGVNFEWDLGSIAVGATRSYSQFYGAAPTKADAVSALEAIDADAWALIQPTGAPDEPTFIWAFSGFRAPSVTLEVEAEAPAWPLPTPLEAGMACAGHAVRVLAGPTEGSWPLEVLEHDYGLGWATGAPAVEIVELPVGVHALWVKVTDSQGRSAFASQILTVVDCNVAPVAVFAMDVSDDCVHPLVSVSAAAAVDPDGGTLVYLWSWGDGSPPATGVVAEHVYADRTPVDLILQVSDDDGRSAQSILSFPPPGDPNCPPELAPLHNVAVVAGAHVAFPVGAADADGPFLEIVADGLGALTFTASPNEAAGTYQLDTTNLAAGDYAVVFKARDGIDEDAQTVVIHVARWPARAPTVDADHDGVADASDNCAAVVNDQADDDHDGAGDSCDLDPISPERPAGPLASDVDHDGVADVADNCVTVANHRQQDRDHDGIGDACEDDVDVDGIPQTSDNCPGVRNADQADRDADGVGDACALTVAGTSSPGGAAQLGRTSTRARHATDPSGTSHRPVMLAVAVGAIASLAWMLRRPWAWLALFSRIRRDQLAEHPARARILELAEARGAVTASDTAAALGLTRTSATHHLASLRTAGLLVARRQGKIVAYTLPGHEPPAASLRAETARNLLRLAESQPGVALAAAARQLGVAYATVSHHAGRLAKDGLLRVRGGRLELPSLRYAGGGVPPPTGAGTASGV